MSLKIEDALNDCLERMKQGEDIDHCIERYPQHRDELVTLLRIAKVTMQAASDASHTEDVKARCLARFNIALVNRKQASRWAFLSYFTQPLFRPMMAGFVAVFVVIVAAGGTTVAAEDTVPGDSLYWVKTTRENATLAMPRSDISKAHIHAQLATERSEEIRKLIRRGRFIEAEMMMRKFDHHLNQSASNAGFILVTRTLEMPYSQFTEDDIPSAASLRMRLEQDEITHRNRMESIIETTPPSQKRVVRAIYHRSELGYRILIQALDENNNRIARADSMVIIVPTR